MAYLRGIVVLFFYLLNMLIISISALICSVFVYAVPNQTWRHRGMLFLHKFPAWWMDLNHMVTYWNTRHKLHIDGPMQQLKSNGSYVMISNHCSWIDILLLGDVFNRRIPVLKFFMKKQLLWSLPLAGIVCYILGYPFMARHTREQIRKNPALKGKDLETTKLACQKLKKEPTTLINFVEGTRFTIEKKQQQESPFQHLLKPKATGTAIVINEMHDKLDGIINVTICYKPTNVSFWQFACGRFQDIHVNFELLSTSQEILGDYYHDRALRARVHQWLNTIWQRKDIELTRIKENQDDQTA